MNLRKLIAVGIACTSLLCTGVSAFASESIYEPTTENNIVNMNDPVVRARPHDWEEKGHSEWRKVDCEVYTAGKHNMRIFTYRCRVCGKSGVYNQYDCSYGCTDTDYRSNSCPG